MSDDRRRSWRELDRSRDRNSGGNRRRDPSEKGREYAQRTGAYSAYKAQLEKMFTPGGTGLPEHLKANLGPVSEESRARQEAARRLREEPSDESFRAYLEAGLDLPEDGRFLMSLFECIEDEGLLRVVLERLLAVVEGGRRPNRMLLIQRLTLLEQKVEQEETLELVRDLRGALD